MRILFNHITPLFLSLNIVYHIFKKSGSYFFDVPKKFEDLDQVIDASSQNKEVVSGYHVCESVILTEKEKQPISVYSNIYSCKSDGFKSMNDYTIKSIDKVIDTVGSKEKDKSDSKKIDMVFDRGYDCNQICR